MKQSPALKLLIVLTLWIATSELGLASDADHLVPMEKAVGSSAVYEQLWRQQLLVTSGQIARFVGLPGSLGVETSISVYQAPGKENSLPGNYWVTATQASQRLWNYVQDPANSVDHGEMHVVRCDAPIATSAAVAIHNCWLAMLSHARPQRPSNLIRLDSSRELFSAVDEGGKLWEAQNSGDPKAKTKMLIDIALSLLEYCGLPEAERADKARGIEKTAAALITKAKKSGRARKPIEGR